MHLHVPGDAEPSTARVTEGGIDLPKQNCEQNAFIQHICFSSSIDFPRGRTVLNQRLGYEAQRLAISKDTCSATCPEVFAHEKGEPGRLEVAICS